MDFGKRIELRSRYFKLANNKKRVEFLNATNKYTFQRNKIQNFRSIEIKPRNTTLSYFTELNNNSKKKLRKRKFTSSKSRNIEEYETRFNNLLSQSAIRRNNLDKYINFKKPLKKSRERGVFSRTDKNRFSLSSDHYTPENSAKGEKSEYFKRSPINVFERFDRFKSQDKRRSNSKTNNYSYKLSNLWNSTRPNVKKIHNLYKSLKPDKSPDGERTSRNNKSSKVFLKEYKNLMYKKFSSKDKVYNKINSSSKFKYSNKANKDRLFKPNSKQNSVEMKPSILTRSMQFKNILESKDRASVSQVSDLPYQFSQSNFQEVFTKKSKENSGLKDRSYDADGEMDVLDLTVEQPFGGQLGNVLREVKHVMERKNDVIRELRKDNLDLKDRVRELENVIRKLLPDG